MMENGFFGVPVATDDRNAIALDGSSLQMTPSALDQLNLDNQNQRLAVYTGFSAFPREQIDDLHTDFHTRNQSMAVYSDALVASLGRNIMREALPGSSSCPADTEFQEQFVGAMPISSVALATLLDARSDLQDNLSNLAISGASCCPPEFFRTVLPNDCSNASNSSSACSMSHGGVEVFGNTYSKGGLETISAPVGFSAINPISVGFQPCSAGGSVEGNSWMSSGNASASRKDHYDSSTFTNELSLSLATSQPSVINSSSIPDQCSVIDCPGVYRFSWKETRLSSEQTSCNSKELALSCGSHGAGQFSQAIGGSRYLQVIQEILSQIASYLIENLDLMSYSGGGTKSGANNLFSSGYHVEGGLVLLGSSESPNGGHRFELEMDPVLQKRGLEAKKRQLLTLLEVVDSRYNQCLDEIHTVISAFHAATELDPQIHTRFALQTIAFLYRSLRERISNQILAMGAHFESSCAIETGGSSEPSYFQNQYTLQQLKKRDHQLWRPQRGLPERSVSVLRAWMFQNFLHPYPKDSEKHLLAIKSGLTRSQVSNWFINARVRLWKPMIEEMYAEMNRRKPLQKDEETNSSHRSQITLRNHGFNLDES